MIKLGSDPKIKDNNGHGPMHIAASQGRVAMFVYFHSIGLTHEEEDLHKRLPLHLASIEGFDTMSMLIIA